MTSESAKTSVVLLPKSGGVVAVSARCVGPLLGRAHGYDGWYTLEQDTILTVEPGGEGPVADVRSSAEYLRTILDRSH